MWGTLGMTCQVSNSDQTLTDCLCFTFITTPARIGGKTNRSDGEFSYGLFIRSIYYDEDHFISSPGDINSECSLILSSINDKDF